MPQDAFCAAFRIHDNQFAGPGFTLRADVDDLTRGSESGIQIEFSIRRQWPCIQQAKDMGFVRALHVATSLAMEPEAEWNQGQEQQGKCDSSPMR